MLYLSFGQLGWQGPAVTFGQKVRIWLEDAVQGLAKRRSPGLANFNAAVAYHFCLALPAAFMQPGDGLLLELCSFLLN